MRERTLANSSGPFISLIHCLLAQSQRSISRCVAASFSKEPTAGTLANMRYVPVASRYFCAKARKIGRLVIDGSSTVTAYSDRWTSVVEVRAAILVEQAA